MNYFPVMGVVQLAQEQPVFAHGAENNVKFEFMQYLCSTEDHWANGYVASCNKSIQLVLQ
jgi:hypothetical protein